MLLKRSFQSALAPKDERYDLLTGPRRRSPLFQSALAPKDERYYFPTHLWYGIFKVSIRSRPEGREIRGSQNLSRRSYWFQSALAPKDERYGTGSGYTGLEKGFQSALAPKDERYPRGVVGSIIGPMVSIRSRPEGREIQSQLYPPKSRQCFNPLSPRRTRDTTQFRSLAEVFNVSIRSRPEGREILHRRADAFHSSKCFNPLSPRRTRDTGPQTSLDRAARCFNPLSPRRTRDTFNSSRIGSRSALFQSALAPKDERYPPCNGINFLRTFSLGFQSALAPKDERYPRYKRSISSRHRECFNPLSPRRTRDTLFEEELLELG